MSPDICSVPHYCTTICRSADNRDHTTTCARVRLFRAGQVLQQVFYIWREYLFDLKIKDASKRDGRLFVYESFYEDGCPPLFDFPNALVPNTMDKAMLLTLQACDDALAYLLEMSKMLFEDITSIVEEVGFAFHHDQRKIIRVWYDGAHDNGYYRHLAMVVECIDGEAYVIDLAGAQNGQHKAMLPLKEYIAMHTIDFREVHPLGRQAEHMAQMREGKLDDSLDERTDFRIQHMQHEAHRRLLQAIRTWEESSGTCLRDLLSFKSADYQRGKAALLAGITQELKAFLMEWKMGACKIEEHKRSEIQCDARVKHLSSAECTLDPEDFGSVAYQMWRAGKKPRAILAKRERDEEALLDKFRAGGGTVWNIEDF